MTSGTKRSRKTTVSASVPPPEPIAAAVSLLTGQSLASVENSFEKIAQKETTYRHADERIWAAQFTPLDVHFHHAGKANQTSLPSQVSLGNLPDLKNAGIRGGEQAEVKEQLEAAAEVVGLDEADRERWDENPLSMLETMHDIDWGTLNMLSSSIKDMGE